MPSDKPSHRGVHRQAVTINQAAAESPVLSQLGALVKLSQQNLEAIVPLLPGHLRTQVKAGPLTGKDWCLLVKNSATASKLRQLLPDIEATVSAHMSAPMKVRIRILGADGA